MAEKSFPSGATVYAQDAASEFVYVIRSGGARVVRRDDAGEHVIAELGAGDVFGEMAAISGRPHLASVTAISEMTVDEIARDVFLRRLSESPGIAFAILRKTVERLRAADLKLADVRKIEPVAWAEMRLKPLTESAARQMPPGGLVIRNLPFRAGRRAVKGEHPPAMKVEPVHLILEDAAPYQLNREHFVIEDSAMGPILRDCGSQRGTIVNGTELGGKHRHLSTPLLEGANEIVAGGEDSPFRFSLTVLATEQPPHRRS